MKTNNRILRSVNCGETTGAMNWYFHPLKQLFFGCIFLLYSLTATGYDYTRWGAPIVEGPVEGPVEGAGGLLVLIIVGFVIMWFFRRR